MSESERYRPLQLLATGGMSELWLAHDRGTGTRGRFVALKRMTSKAIHHKLMRELFIAESRLLSQLQHPNIVQVLDSNEGDDGSAPWLVLEFLLGADVRTLLARAAEVDRQLPIEAACAIVAGAARGLHFAHQKRDPTGDSLRVVHRDVSPHNVFVTRDGAVKVLDFGIARSNEQLRSTAPTELKGKLGYMAPEQLEGRTVDARTDIYGLGVVLWELITGRRLWHRDHPLMANWATLHELPPPPSELRPEVSHELESLVLSMLARAPSDRPPDAEQVAIVLERQLFALGCASSTDAIRDVVVELAPTAAPSLDLQSIPPPATPASVAPAAAQPAQSATRVPSGGTSIRTRGVVIALAALSAVMALLAASAVVVARRATQHASNAQAHVRLLGAPRDAVLEVDGERVADTGVVRASTAPRRVRLLSGEVVLLDTRRVIDRDLELYFSTVSSAPTAGAALANAVTDAGVARPASAPSSRARAPRVVPNRGNGTSSLPYVLTYE